MRTSILGPQQVRNQHQSLYLNVPKNKIPDFLPSPGCSPCFSNAVNGTRHQFSRPNTQGSSLTPLLPWQVHHETLLVLLAKRLASPPPLYPHRQLSLPSALTSAMTSKPDPRGAHHSQLPASTPGPLHSLFPLPDTPSQLSTEGLPFVTQVSRKASPDQEVLPPLSAQTNIAGQSPSISSLFFLSHILILTL